jgi:chromosome segregation ATPase
MNAKVVAILLVLVALALGAGWYFSVDKAREERETAATRLNTLSNQLVSATLQLNEEQKDNATLKTNLVERIELAGVYSNKLSFITAELTRTELEAKESAAKAQAELDKRDRQIAGLEGEKDDLNQQMSKLTGQITGLEGRIQDTERRLATSEGDREVLKKELRRLVAEKSELERKFQNLAVLRDQVQKLREELSIAKRMEFIRKGLYGFDKKGGQLLQEGVRRSVVTSSPPVDARLQVEVKGDGSATVLPNTPTQK